MKRLSILLMALVGTVLTYAATDVATYYAAASGKKGQALKSALAQILINHTVRTYAEVWEDYKTTDVTPEGNLWDMYSSISHFKPGGIAQGQGQGGQEGTCYNREHSFPKSWWGNWNKGEAQYTDLFHLIPTDGVVNSRRSNNAYGEVGTTSYTSYNNFTKIGAASSSLGYTGTVLEPNDVYKGDIARQMFYMVTCYEDSLAAWYVTYNSNPMINGASYDCFQSWAKTMLMRWAKNDVVGPKEQTRNEAVYGIQGNRNPFIDFPGLEEYIWGSMTSTAFNPSDYVVPSGYAAATEESSLPYVSVLTQTLSGKIYTFSKVTSAGDIAAGETYILVRESGTTCAAGIPNSNQLSSCDVDIESDVITTKYIDQPGFPYPFTLSSSSTSGQYYMRLDDGNYLVNGMTSSSKHQLNVSSSLSDAASWTVSYASSGVSISSSSPYAGYLIWYSGSKYFYMNSSDVSGTSLYRLTSVVDDPDANPNLDVATYVKVTEEPASWEGEYLIAYQPTSSLAITINGAADASTLTGQNRGDSLTVVGGTTIYGTDDIDAQTFIVTKKSGYSGYFVCSASGHYIGNTAAKNQLQTTDTDNDTYYTNAISLVDGKVHIKANGVTSDDYFLQYNTSYKYWRYYKGTQQYPVLFKKVTDDEEPQIAQQTPTASFAEENITLLVGTTQVQTVTTNSDGAVTYSSSDESVATVDASTGRVTAVSPGTAVITASIAECTYYYAASATYTVTVEAADETENYYVLVTSEPDDWSGEYLIGYQISSTEANVMNGAGTTATALAQLQTGLTAVPVTSLGILSTDETDATSFTITSVDGGYSIQSKSGYYIGRDTKSAGVSFKADSVYLNSLTWDETNGCPVITCQYESNGTTGTTKLQYNGTGTNKYFRYYTGTYENIVLFRKNFESTPEPEPEVDTLQFARVTTVTSGKRYLIATASGDVLKLAVPLASDKTYGYLPTSDATDQDGICLQTDTVNTWTLTSTDGGYHIQDSQGRYLYQTGSYTRFNVTTDANVTGTVWSISFDADGRASVSNNSVGKTIQYSTSYSSYGSYATVTNTLPYLYEEVEEAEPIDVSISGLAKLIRKLLDGEQGYTISNVQTLIDQLLLRE